MLCIFFRFRLGAGDLAQALIPAHDFIEARAPLSWPVSPYYIPSPLTIIPLGLPFVPFAEPIAAGLFIGLSCGFLAASIIDYGQPWRLLIFLSPAVLLNIYYVQYPILLLALALSRLAPLGLLIKPHIALPLVMSYRGRRAAWAGAFFVAGLSLLVYPLWPLTWLSQLRQYSGTIPALMPLGAGLLLSVLNIRRGEGRLVLFASILPQRGVYDQVAFMMLPRSLRSMAAFLCVSWALMLLPEPARMLAGCYVALGWLFIGNLKK
jgi:hypothetical protein